MTNIGEAGGPAPAKALDSAPERCELCGSQSRRTLFRGHDWLHGQNVEATVVQCRECGLIYLSPRPLQPSDYYPMNYEPHLGQRDPEGIAYAGGHQGGLARKARLVSQSAPGSLLDVGCGAGEFLATVRELDERSLWGTDISTQAVRRAYGRLGGHVWVGDVPGLPLAEQVVGAVTLWHVVEHLSHPLEALRDMARVLCDDGTLFVACPMADSWEANLFGRYWAGYDVPRHPFAFSRQTLPRLLRSAGLEAGEVPGIVWGYNSARISCAFWLRHFAMLRRHPWLVRGLAALLGGCAAVVFEGLSRVAGNRRAVGVFVARKRGSSASLGPHNHTTRR